MKVASPRKGTELIPRVFASWQEQVNRAIRNLGFVRAVSAKVTQNFTSIAAHSEQTADFTVTGARLDGAVSVSWGDTALPTGLVLDAKVQASDSVRVRANNYTAIAQDPASNPISIVVFNL